MKLFQDADLKYEIDLLDLGRLPAGETKQYVFYVSNDSAAILEDLVFSVEHEEAKVIKAPTEMPIRAVSELVIEWSPSVTLKEGLKTRLIITGKEIWS